MKERGDEGEKRLRREEIKKREEMKERRYEGEKR